MMGGGPLQARPSARRGGKAAVGDAAAYPGKEAADPTPPSLDLAIPWLDPAGGCVVGGETSRGCLAHQAAAPADRRWHVRALAERRRRHAGDDASDWRWYAMREICAAAELQRRRASGAKRRQATAAMAARGSAWRCGGLRGCGPRSGQHCGDDGGGDGVEPKASELSAGGVG